MTLVISYRTPVRSTPRHTMASGGVLVASIAMSFPRRGPLCLSRRGPPIGRRFHTRGCDWTLFPPGGPVPSGIAWEGRKPPWVPPGESSFVDAEQRADSLDHGHLPQGG